MQAAVLHVKLPHVAGWAAARERHASRYTAEFAKLGVTEAITSPSVAAGCSHVWNQYTVRVADGRRDALHKYLTDRKIGSAIYYPVPLHLQKCFAGLGYEEGSLPVTEQACREVLSLPVYPELTAVEQETVIEAVAEFCEGAGRAAA